MNNEDAFEAYWNELPEYDKKRYDKGMAKSFFRAGQRNLDILKKVREKFQYSTLQTKVEVNSIIDQLEQEIKKPKSIGDFAKWNDLPCGVEFDNDKDE
jgi:hypothetical protein